jgi:gluconolactonase
MKMRLALLFLLVIATSLGLPQSKKPARKFELQAQSPQFWNLVSRDAKLNVVATGFGFTEGPVWDQAGFLYVSDEELNKIFRVFPDGHKQEVISLGDPDGNTYDRRHSGRSLRGKEVQQPQ